MANRALADAFTAGSGARKLPGEPVTRAGEALAGRVISERARGDHAVVGRIPDRPGHVRSVVPRSNERELQGLGGQLLGNLTGNLVVGRAAPAESATRNRRTGLSQPARPDIEGCAGCVDLERCDPVATQ